MDRRAKQSSGDTALVLPWEVGPRAANGWWGRFTRIGRPEGPDQVSVAILALDHADPEDLLEIGVERRVMPMWQLVARRDGVVAKAE